MKKYFYIFLAIIPLDSNIDVLGEKIIAGTTVLLLATEDVVVIASDSKEVQHIGEVTEYKQVCKINNIGNLFYVSLGYHEMTNSSYNFEKILNQSILTSIDKTLGKFNRLVKFPMESAFETFSISHPQIVNELKGKPFCTLILVGFESGISKVSWIEYKVDSITGRTIEPTFKFVPHDKNQFIKFGEHDSINRFLARNPKYLETVKIYKGFPELIQMEAANKPEKVGLPVDMIQITKDTAIWLLKNTTCN
jgi:hypothetical protein